MTKYQRQTTLVYTDKEKEAIEKLKSADHPMTAGELGISTAILTSLATKAGKVDAGQLEVPEGTEVFRVNKEKAEREVLKTVTVTLYSKGE